MVNSIVVTPTLVSSPIPSICTKMTIAERCDRDGRTDSRTHLGAPDRDHDSNSGQSTKAERMQSPKISLHKLARSRSGSSMTTKPTCPAARTPTGNSPFPLSAAAAKVHDAAQNCSRPTSYLDLKRSGHVRTNCMTHERHALLCPRTWRNHFARWMTPLRLTTTGLA